MEMTTKRNNLKVRKYMKRETTGRMLMRSLMRAKSLPVMMKRSTVMNAER